MWAPAAACPTLARTLQLDDRGSDVAELQTFLTLSPSGYFDIATQRALQAWQSSRGIISSGSPATSGYGVAGPKTRAAIARCAPALSKTPPAPPATPSKSPSPPTGTVTNIVRSLTLGMRGDDVKALQQKLIALGFLAAGNDSGYFGNLTRAAVQAVQRSRNIVSSGTPATTGYGVVGPKTRAAIALGVERPTAPRTTMPPGSGGGGGSVAPGASPSRPTASGSPAPAPDASIYLSPQGNDANASTLNAPLRTIEAAQERVRQLRVQAVSDITVYLRGGTYWLSSPVTFTASDGGKSGQQVIYASYPGERAVLSGGTPLTLRAHGDGIYAAEAGGMAFRQLYTDRGRPRRARYPLSGYFRLLGFTMSPGSCSGTQNPTAAQAIAAIRIETSQPVAKASEVDALNGSELVLLGTFSQLRLYVDHATWTGEREITVYPGPSSAKYVGCAETADASGYRAYFENKESFLAADGDWSLSDGTTVYYKAGASLPRDTVVAPRLENIIAIRGTASAPVRNLTFRDLEFAHTTWNRPSLEGYVGGQSGVSGFCGIFPGCRIPGAITIQNAQNITITRSKITHMGGSGIQILGGVRDVAITQNAIEDIAGNGIFIDTFAYDPGSLVSDIRIEDNLIRDIGTDYNAAAVLGGFVKNISVSRNLIRDTSYSGVSLGWFGMQDTPYANGTVDHNDISRVMQVYHDGGAIYTMAGTKGLSITDNYIHDFPYTLDRGFGIVDNDTNAHVGLYLDHATSYVAARHNYIHNVTEGLFLQPDPTAPASHNTVMETFMTSVPTIVLHGGAVDVAAKRYENAIETPRPTGNDEIARNAGLSEEAKSLWGAILP